MTRIYRAVFGLPLTVDDIAPLATEIFVAGFTLTPAEGWSPQWGKEVSTVVEFTMQPGALNRVLAAAFVRTLCARELQECAYVTVDGTAPRLWFADGKTVDL